MRSNHSKTPRLLLGAVLILGTACGSDEGHADRVAASENAADPVEITFLSPVPPSFYFFPPFLAEEFGFFEEEGIDLTYETIGESVSPTSLLVNGQADIAGVGTSEVFQGLNAGQEFDLVYEYYTSGVDVLVAPADRGITSLEQLEGSAVGLAADENQSLLVFSLETVGLSLDDVEPVNVGTSPATVANALESGDIDAYVGSITDIAGLDAQGLEMEDMTPPSIREIPGITFAVTPETREELGDALAGFLRAWSKALYAGLEDPDLVEAIMRDLVPEEWEESDSIGRSALDIAIELQQQEPDAFGRMEDETWQLAVEHALVTGEIDKELDVSSFIDGSFVAGANDFDRAEVDAAVEEWRSANG